MYGGATEQSPMPEAMIAEGRARRSRAWSRHWQGPGEPSCPAIAANRIWPAMSAASTVIREASHSTIGRPLHLSFWAAMLAILARSAARSGASPPLEKSCADASRVASSFRPYGMGGGVESAHSALAASPCRALILLSRVDDAAASTAASHSNTPAPGGVSRVFTANPVRSGYGDVTHV